MEPKRLFFTIVGALLYLLALLVPSLLVNPPQTGGGYSDTIITRVKLEGAKDEAEASQATNNLALRLGSGVEVRRLGRDTIDISYPSRGDSGSAERGAREIRELATKRPVITLTDNQGRPLFYRGFFSPKPLALFRDRSLNESLFSPPLGPNSATYRYDSNSDRHLVDLKGRDSHGEAELARAKLSALSGLSSGANKIYIWLGYRDLLEQIEREDPGGLRAAGGNPVSYLRLQEQGNQGDGGLLSLLNSLRGGGGEGVGDFKSLAHPNLLGIINVTAVNANIPFSFEVYPSLGSRGFEVVATLTQSQSDYSFKHTLTWLERGREGGVGSYNKLLIGLLVLTLLLALALLLAHRLLSLITLPTLLLAPLVGLATLSLSSLLLTPLTLLTLTLTLITLALDSLNLGERFRVQLQAGLPARQGLRRASWHSFKEFSEVGFIALLGGLLLFYLPYPSISSVGQYLLTLTLVNLLLLALPQRIILNQLNNSLDLGRLATLSRLSPPANPTRTPPLTRFIARLNLRNLSALVRLTINLLTLAMVITLVTYALRQSGLSYGLNVDSTSLPLHQVVVGSGEREGGLVGFKQDTLPANLLNPLTISKLLNLGGGAEVRWVQALGASERVYLKLGSQVVLDQGQLGSLTKLLGGQAATISLDATNPLAPSLSHSLLLAYLSFLLLQLVVSLLRWRLTYAISLLSSSLTSLLVSLIPYALGRIAVGEGFWLDNTLIAILLSYINCLTLSRLRERNLQLSSQASGWLPTTFEIDLATKEGLVDSLRVNLPLTLSLTLALPTLLLLRLDQGTTLPLLQLLLALLLSTLLLSPQRFNFFTQLQRSLRASRIKSNFWETQQPSEEIFEGINNFNY